jgi:PPOX class probable F420-dependent enzyme
VVGARDIGEDGLVPVWHAVRMFDDRALAFLGEVRFARLATIGRDGFPHNVPIWFDLEPIADGAHDLLFISDRMTAKTRNVLVNPRVGVTIGGEPGDAHGYLIRGTVTVEEDPGQTVTHRMIDRYEAGTPRAAELREAWKDDDIVVLRLRPTSIVNVWG